MFCQFFILVESLITNAYSNFTLLFRTSGAIASPVKSTKQPPCSSDILGRLGTMADTVESSGHRGQCAGPRHVAMAALRFPITLHTTVTTCQWTGHVWSTPGQNWSVLLTVHTLLLQEVCGGKYCSEASQSKAEPATSKAMFACLCVIASSHSHLWWVTLF